jgi:hypothetical protein
MTRTPAGAFDWAWNEAHAPTIRSNWVGWCMALVSWAGLFRFFESAIVGGNLSGPMRGDYANAPRGAIIWWWGVGGFGHVAFVVEQGPDPLLLMASGGCTTPWGHGIGLIRLSEYQRKFGWPLRGWTLRVGTETLDFSSTPSGGGGTPIPTPEPEEDIMASIAELEALLEKRFGPTPVELIRDATRRELRYRIVYDHAGTGAAFDDPRVTRAVLAREARGGDQLDLIVLDARPAARTATVEAKKQLIPLQVPPGEQPAGMHTVSFLRFVDSIGGNHPWGEFIENAFELNGGDTVQVRTEGEHPYPSRQHVWADDRPVTIYLDGEKVQRFGTFNGQKVAYIGGQPQPLTAQQVARADSQVGGGQAWY